MKNTVSKSHTDKKNPEVNMVQISTCEIKLLNVNIFFKTKITMKE